MISGARVRAAADCWTTLRGCVTRGERPPGSLHQGGFFKELQKEQKCKIGSVQLFDHRGLTENVHSCFLDRQTKRCKVSGQTRKQPVLDDPHKGEVTQPYYRSNGCHKLKKIEGHCTLPWSSSCAWVSTSCWQLSPIAQLLATMENSSLVCPFCGNICQISFFGCNSTFFVFLFLLFWAIWNMDKVGLNYHRYE